MIRARGAAIVLGISLAISLIAQRWTGLDTPDSSFYASLGLFGSEVSDRALFNSYYWTRLGVILPNRLLHEVFGTWGGFAVFRFLLILAIVGSTYALCRRFVSIPTAAFVTSAVSLSSVVLSYLGNPYLTGSVMAGTAVLIALSQSDRRSAAIGAGATLGWLAMVNPPGLLLAGTIWLVLRIQRRAPFMHLLVSALSATITFVGFLALGRWAFPAMDWFGSYVNENARIDYRNFASTDAVWLRDISLLVPVMILIITIGIWVKHRDSRAAQMAFTTSAASIAFLLVFNPLMGGIPLEAPLYQSMLWPPALISLALSTCALATDYRWNARSSVAAVIGVAVIIGTGRVSPGLTLGLGVVIAIALVIVFLLLANRGLVLTITALVIVCAGGQLLQNSRGDLGLYYLSPYAWAFADNPISDRIHTAVNSQEWLLAHTSNQDRILDWVEGDWTKGDRELYVVAGMQLWGENRITLERTLNQEDVARMNAIKPTVIAMFGQSREGVLRFWQSIPSENEASAPICYDYPWTPSPTSPVTITEGHTCLTTLRWS